VTTAAVAGGVLGTVSGAAAGIGSACYVRSWLQHRALPNRISWSVFSLIYVAAFTALLIHHTAWPLLVMPGESAIGCTVILILSLRRGTGDQRWWQVKEQYDTAAYRRHCRRIAVLVADVVEYWVDQGKPVVLIGVDGSPSMGVKFTSSDRTRGGEPFPPVPHADLVPGEGIFIEELQSELMSRGRDRIPTAAETHDLPSHDLDVQRVTLESLLSSTRPA